MNSQLKRAIFWRMMRPYVWFGVRGVSKIQVEGLEIKEIQVGRSAFNEKIPLSGCFHLNVRPFSKWASLGKRKELLLFPAIWWKIFPFGSLEGREKNTGKMTDQIKIRLFIIHMSEKVFYFTHFFFLIIIKQRHNVQFKFFFGS